MNRKVKKWFWELKKLEEISDKKVEEIKQYLIGKTITINDPNFNGQKYGSSKKSLYGKSFIFTKDHDLIYFNGMLYTYYKSHGNPLHLDNCIIS